jgi:2-oxoglutarate dehydrogenase E1 component
MDAFGPNEWLVDEIYQQYLKDPHSVDKAWWEFFADYRQPRAAGQSSVRPDQDGAARPQPMQLRQLRQSRRRGSLPTARHVRPPHLGAPAAPAPVSNRQPGARRGGKKPTPARAPPPQPASRQPTGGRPGGGRQRRDPSRCGVPRRVVTNMETSLQVPHCDLGPGSPGSSDPDAGSSSTTTWSAAAAGKGSTPSDRLRHG